MIIEIGDRFSENKNLLSKDEINKVERLKEIPFNFSTNNLLNVLEKSIFNTSPCAKDIELTKEILMNKALLAPINSLNTIMQYFEFLDMNTKLSAAGYFDGSKITKTSSLQLFSTFNSFIKDHNLNYMINFSSFCSPIINANQYQNDNILSYKLVKNKEKEFTIPVLNIPACRTHSYMAEYHSLEKKDTDASIEKQVPTLSLLNPDVQICDLSLSMLNTSLSAAQALTDIFKYLLSYEYFSEKTIELCNNISPVLSLTNFNKVNDISLNNIINYLVSSNFSPSLAPNLFNSYLFHVKDLSMLTSLTLQDGFEKIKKQCAITDSIADEIIHDFLIGYSYNNSSSSILNKLTGYSTSTPFVEDIKNQVRYVFAPDVGMLIKEDLHEKSN